MLNRLNKYQGSKHIRDLKYDWSVPSKFYSNHHIRDLSNGNIW